MIVRRVSWLGIEAIALVACLLASVGLSDALRHLPGPGVALALPLRETGHGDRASLLVVAGCSAVVFGLAALALARSAGHPLRGALLRGPVVLACALAAQALSLELVRQASLGFDWAGALRSASPFATTLGAVLGIAAADFASSSDRGMRHRPNERPVEGRSGGTPVVKIAP
jgi:hypothetical protein